MKKLLLILSSILMIGVLVVGCGDSNPISKMDTKPVMSGMGNNEIGKFGEAKYNPDKITDEDLVKFYNENVKDSGLNWVVLIDKNDYTKGIVFTGSSNILTYGTISKNGDLVNSDKTRIIENNKIKDFE